LIGVVLFFLSEPVTVGVLIRSILPARLPVKIGHLEPQVHHHRIFLKSDFIPIVINICAYLIKSEIRISKSETSTNDQNSNDRNRIKMRPSSIVHRPSRLRRAHFIITFGINSQA